MSSWSTDEQMGEGGKGNPLNTESNEENSTLGEVLRANHKHLLFMKQFFMVSIFYLKWETAAPGS